MKPKIKRLPKSTDKFNSIIPKHISSKRAMVKLGHTIKNAQKVVEKAMALGKNEMLLWRFDVHPELFTFSKDENGGTMVTSTPSGNVVPDMIRAQVILFKPAHKGNRILDGKVLATYPETIFFWYASPTQCDISVGDCNLRPETLAKDIVQCLRKGQPPSYGVMADMRSMM